MQRYFFDYRDGDSLVVDSEGLTFSGLGVVQQEVARAMADLARDELPQIGGARSMAIEVRDHAGPVLHAKLAFQITLLR